MPLRILSFPSPGALNLFVNAAQEVTGAAIVSGGTGYEVDDILTVVGGDGEVLATLRVVTEGSKIITGIAVENEGAYTTAPTNPVSVIGGSGNDDATFNLTLGAAVAAADLDQISQRNGQWFLLYWV